MVLVTEPAVLHASGVALFTQRLIPQRPVALIVPRAGDPIVLACVLEEAQLRADHPELPVATYPEFGVDPWKVAASVLPLGSDRVLVEDEFPLAWADGLRAALPDTRVERSYPLTTEPRRIKTAAEIEFLRELSRAADAALVAGARATRPGVSEAAIAGVIAAAFTAPYGARATDVSASCITPVNSRNMHHHPGDDPIPERGLVRLLVVGRVDGYWIIIARMLVVGDDPVARAWYARYAALYDDVLRRLEAGRRGTDIYSDAVARVAAEGLRLETLKVGHGTGLDFRELPWLAPGRSDILEPGQVLAYDYGLETPEGLVLHIEDRVLVTEDGPVVLSDVWDYRVADGRGYEEVR